MTANNKNLNTEIGGTSNSVSLTPIEFLKMYWGKRVNLEAKGIFIDDLLNRKGETIKSEYFIGIIAGKYKVVIDFGEVILKAQNHAIAVRQLDFVQINGVKVRGE
jgi:hypothetical protein